MKLIVSKTVRGFACIKFTDLYGNKCSLQKSNLATKDAIWLDITPPKEALLSTRMHLTKEQVTILLPILHNFVETGEVKVPLDPQLLKLLNEHFKK